MNEKNRNSFNNIKSNLFSRFCIAIGPLFFKLTVFQFMFKNTFHRPIILTICFIILILVLLTHGSFFLEFFRIIRFERVLRFEIKHWRILFSF